MRELLGQDTSLDTVKIVQGTARFMGPREPYYNHAPMAKRSRTLIAAFFWVLSVQAAFGQELQTGLFGQTEASLVSPRFEPETQRSRNAGIDLEHLHNALRRREILQLNLFDDVQFAGRVERVRPTRRGHFLHGRLINVEGGEFSIVVNGTQVVGEVRSTQGIYTIRPGDFGRYVIRQIEPLPPGPAIIPEPGKYSENHAEPSNVTSRMISNEDSGEDGSTIDVLVAYTPGAYRTSGGKEAIETTIDWWIHYTNFVYEKSEIDQRIRLVHTALINYKEISSSMIADLERLKGKTDGYMDEIHTLRDWYAADIVTLMVGGRPFYFSGRAYQLNSENDPEFNQSAFNIVRFGGGASTFSHELGHNMGLAHERSSGHKGIFPYSHGYVNQKAFKFTSSLCFITIMASGEECSNADLGRHSIGRFSNPELEYMGDPTGVPADSASLGVDGPADARSTLNNTKRFVASFRTDRERNCQEMFVQTDREILSYEGGEVVISVHVPPECSWSVKSESEFITVSPSSGEGPGTVRADVQPSDGLERFGTLMVEDQPVNIRQVAKGVGICSRSLHVQDSIMLLTRRETCAQVTVQDLHKIVDESLAISVYGSRSLKKDDFKHLINLKRLLINGDHAHTTEAAELTELPDGILDELGSLEKFRVIGTRLNKLQSGLFRQLNNLKSLELFDNEIDVIAEGAFEGLSQVSHLYLQENKFTTVPGRIFADLSSLELLNLNSGEIETLPANAFAGLSSLKTLEAGWNNLVALPDGIFRNLTSLERLVLNNNQLKSLPENLFSGLSNLKWIEFRNNPLVALSPGLFIGLTSLEWIWMNGNAGAPFPLVLNLKQADVPDDNASGLASVKVQLVEGALFPMVLELSVSGGTISTLTATIAQGYTESDPFTVTAGGDGPVEVRLVEAPDLPNRLCQRYSGSPSYPREPCYQGFRTEAGEPLVLFQRIDLADVNEDGGIDADDALALYYAYALVDLLGNGDAGGIARFRETLLEGRVGESNPSDDDLRQMLRRADDWKGIGVGSGGDMNADGRIDSDDALVMYYAYALEELLGDGTTGGIARFRQSLLAGRTGQPDPSDDVLRQMLRRAHDLRSKLL